MCSSDLAEVMIAGVPAHVSRSGYTGEDGFELSIAACDVVRVWDLLLDDPRVKPIGLGARDSLRLEGGLCLYGHDIDTSTSPVEGALAWSIQKRRRETGGFPGAARSLAAASQGARLEARAALALLAGSRGRRHNKRWAMDRYECARWKHAAWWIASLPFRLSVYGGAPSARPSPQGGPS